MDKPIRLLHDLYTQVASRAGGRLRRADEAGLEETSTRTWTVQEGGSLTLKNPLEHHLYPDQEPIVEMRWPTVRGHEIADARVTGDDCNVFLPDGQLLGDCPSLANQPDRKIRRSISWGSTHIQETCLLLGGRNFENHGHFILHHLPRLAASMPQLREIGVRHLLLGNKRKNWQERYIEAVAEKSFQILRTGPGTTRIERLIYIPQLWSNTALASPEILLRLRAAFLDHSKGGGSPPPTTNSQAPILISRDDAPDRRLLNETEIAAEITAQWGSCEILRLSEFSFSEQIQKFSTAPLIVGALGQGFANLIAASGTLCLILDTEPDWAESYFSRTFRDLALLNGNAASRLFAGITIQKRDHWSFPMKKFSGELAAATAFFNSHRPIQPTR